MLEYFIGCTLLTLLLLYLLSHWKRNVSSVGFRTDVNPAGMCDSPTCIRCDKNNKVRCIALERFQNYYQSVKEVHRLQSCFANILNRSDYIFHCDFLTSKPIWSYSDLPRSYIEDLKLLQENIDVFKEDYQKLADESEIGNQDSVDWTKYFLFNQGVCDDRNLEKCLRTNIILKNCSNLMVSCLYGYQFFSVLKPGASIEAHTGPTNIRLRCHVSLQLPKKNCKQQCQLNVADETVSWDENGILLFDDSLLHSAKYTSGIDDEKIEDCCVNRVVLLLDFWHPDLSLDERDCLTSCFSSISL